MRIADIPNVERPREKLIAKGRSNLKMNELFAILFRSGRKGMSALDIGSTVIKRLTNESLLQVSYAELEHIDGMDQSKICSLLAAIEIGKRLYQKTSHSLYINEPEQALYHLADIRHLKKEHFVVLYLNARQEVLHKETVSIGTLNASIVHPREVFEPALKQLASAVILAHNHPSGDKQPSDADIAITKRLVQAGKLMGIEVIDHIIVTTDSYYSFQEENMI